MVQPGASPAIYEPKPRQMAKISKAAIYYAVGVPFEDVWLERISAANPAMLVVHTDKDIQKLPIGSEIITRGDHHHSDRPDPHTWLSPPLVKIQVHHILKALVEVDSDHRILYEANYRHLLKEIDAVHAELKEIFSGKQGQQFMVFHPSWGYFAHTYGLKQVAVEIEGKVPKPAQFKELIQLARKHHIKVIFVQPQFSAKSAQLIADAVGGQVVAVDPLALNWAQNLREIAGRVKAALR